MLHCRPVIELHKLGVGIGIIVGLAASAPSAPASAMTASERNTAAMACAHDASLTQEQRVEGLLKHLIAEVETPSETVMGIGGAVSSDYVQSNILVALRNHGSLDVLNRVAPKDLSPRAALIIDLARARLGDRAAIPAALGVLDSDAGPFVRRSAIAALSALGAREAIPALKAALSDPYCFEVLEGPVSPGHERKYPVRAAAALALKRLGVRVVDVAPYVYEMDAEQSGSLGEPSLGVPVVFANGRPLLPLNATARRVGAAVPLLFATTRDAEGHSSLPQAVESEIYLPAELLAKAFDFQFKVGEDKRLAYIWPFAVVAAETLTQPAG